MEYPIIDSHAHIWTHDPRYPWAKETVHPPPNDANVNMLLDKMRAHRVAQSLLVQVIHYRWDNSYVADCMARFPDRFRGVARVNPTDPAAPDHVSELIAAHGFAGIRISPAEDEQGDWIRGPLMTPLWGRCRDEKVSINVLAPAGRLPDIAPLIEKFQDLDVVIDHMADCPPNRPERLRHLLSLKRYPRVFVKLSHTWALSRQPYPYPDCQIQVKKLYDAFGSQRLMWATDWPLVEGYCGYAKALAVVRDEMPFLNAEDKRWLLSKTAQGVYGF